MGIFDKLNEMIQAQNREKPGAICDKTCKLGEEFCKDCLVRQERILAGISELEAIEANIELMRIDPAGVQAKKFTKCTLCAAPYEQGARTCPFCDTPYPTDALTVDLPKSGVEQDKLLLDKAAAVYADFRDWRKNLGKPQGQEPKKNAFVKGLNTLSMLMTGYAMENMQDMNSQQIRDCSRQYGVGYREYIYGVMVGTYKSHGELILEEKQRQMEAQNQAQRQAQQERNRQMLQGGGSSGGGGSSSGGRYTMMDYMERRASSSSGPGYVGGSTRCCGNCKFYGAGQCCATGGKFQGFSRSASDDTCGWYEMK